MPVSSMVLLILEQLQAILRKAHVEAYFVGGCVRDLLMGRPLHDLDLVVAGDALGLARTVARAFRATFVLLDEEAGIARVVLRAPEGESGLTIDLARMRGNELAADLAGRDLTINAIAMEPPAFFHYASGETTQPQRIDPLNGEKDLREGRLRAPSRQSFLDDPLRTMRVVRLAGELQMAIEPETAAWVRQTAELLPQSSWERIRDELARLLACPQAAPYLPLLDRLGLLPHILPEAIGEAGLEHLWETVSCLEWIAAVIGNQPVSAQEEPYWRPAALASFPHLSLRLPYRSHLQRYLTERVSGDRTRLEGLKLAAMLHHAEAKAGRRVGQRLRLSARETLALDTTVTWAGAPGQEAIGKVSRRSIYRFYRDAGESATGILLLSLAHDLAEAGPALDLAWWKYRVSQVTWILTLRYERQSEVIHPPRLLDGSELIAELHLEPGPLIGQLLEDIREAQAAGEVRTREEALAWARRALEE